MLRWTYKPKLVPVNQLRCVSEGTDQWESTGPDPEFQLKDVPSGWVKLSFTASSERPVDFTLYAHDRDGLLKEKSFNIGFVINKEKSYSATIPLDSDVSALRLDPGDCPTRFVIREVKLVKMTEMHVLAGTLWNFFCEKENRSFGALFGALARAFSALRAGGRRGLHAHVLEQVKAGAGIHTHHYGLWIKQHTPTPEELQKMARQSVELPYTPAFSILILIHDAEKDLLKRSIESVLSQAYPYWDLTIMDGTVTRPPVRQLLQSYKTGDHRVKVIDGAQNTHSLAAVDGALSFAEGDFVCLMDSADEISPDALFEFAQFLNLYPDTDMIYSDEDRIDTGAGRFEPFFKPDWSPEYLEAFMYTGRFACYRKEIARRVGGFRDGYEGAYEYDFLLRFTEQAPRKIRHIPKILYHRRVTRNAAARSGKVGQYRADPAAKALDDRLKRLKLRGAVLSGAYPGCFEVRHDITGNPLVSIIIPSAGKSAQIRGKDVDMLSHCINSITDKSTGANYEIIVIDNNDLTEHTIKAIKQPAPGFIHYEGELNIAEKMNLGARNAAGTYFLFLNDDTEVISPDWIQVMLQVCQRPGVGVVGAKLYFEDMTIQHAGVVLTETGIPTHVLHGSPSASPGYFFSSVANRNYLAVTGACLMTRKEVFEQVGGFNQAFAVTCNDVDYCLKVHKAGYRIVFAAHAELFHYQAKTRGKSTSEEQEYDLFKKLWGFQGKDPYYSVHLKTNPPNFELKIGDR